MKILLVEDDERIVDFLVRGLSSEGHKINVATDGGAGFQMATSSEWDVIILDLMLPVMDGREVCRKVRTEKIETPILMLTALETTSDVVQGLKMGADDYMTKPFAFDELLARLEVLARRGSGRVAPSESLLVAGDIEFDRDALAVTVAGQDVEMTSLEYALLEFLMVEAGRVVSRARILQNVWGAHEDPLTNVVDVYIRRLRNKLSGSKFGGDCITTIRGRGYKFIK